MSYGPDNAPSDIDKAIQSLEKLICRTNFPSKEQWMVEVRAGSLDSWVALLISQLPNLKSLDLDFYPRHSSAFIGMMFQHDLTSSPPVAVLSDFRHLHKIDNSAQKIPRGSSPWYHEIDINIEHVAPLFYLPVIQTLRLSNVERSPLLFHSGTRLPCVSTLTTLIIDLGRIDENALEQLLSVCPRLETLKYRFEVDAESPVKLSGEKLGRALQHIKATVKTLQISVGFFTTTILEVGWDFSCALEGRLGSSLTRFDKLERLEIPFAVLLGWHIHEAPAVADVLPVQLRHLHLTDDVGYFEEYEWDEASYVAAIKRYLETMKGKDATSPRLERISLGLQWLYDHPRRGGAMQELSEACGASGVALHCTGCSADPNVFEDLDTLGNEN